MSSFDISLDREKRLVRVKVFGELHLKFGEELITTARTTAAEHRYNILYDLRETQTIVSYADLYNLARRLDVYSNPATRRIKAAIILSPEDKAVEDYKFYELVTDNVGLQLRIFFDEDEAGEWVCGKLPKNNENTSE